MWNFKKWIISEFLIFERVFSIVIVGKYQYNDSKQLTGNRQEEQNKLLFSFKFNIFFFFSGNRIIVTPPEGFPILRPNIPYKKYTDVRACKVQN